MNFLVQKFLDLQKIEVSFCIQIYCQLYEI